MLLLTGREGLISLIDLVQDSLLHTKTGKVYIIVLTINTFILCIFIDL